jgi:hypothetical protein
MLRARTKKKKKSRHGAVILGAVLSFAAVAAVPRVAAASAAAETTKVPKLRTVEGEVCNKGGTPIQGAVVYLKDEKSLEVKSYLSDEQGHFHFRQLSMSLDYDLWAELNGKRSKTKNISQFNSKPDLRYKLKLPVSK